MWLRQVTPANQPHPGDGVIPDIETCVVGNEDGEEDPEATAAAVVEMLQKHCSWGSKLMEFDSLLEMCHTPDESWDFEAKGRWY